MLDFLLALGFIAVWLYGLFDCARNEQDSVRNLPKWAWLLIIILFSWFGSIAWFLFGRPKTVVRTRKRPGTMIPPDDDPDFLRKL